MNRSRQLFVFLLALWLPLHALAGSLVHCDQLHAGDAGMDHHGMLHAEQASGSAANCHGADPAASSTQQGDQHDGICLHCDGSCHGAQSLMSTDGNLPDSLRWPAVPGGLSTPFPSIVAETPQRPPRISS